MFFTSSEQRQRFAAFDSLVGSTHEMLSSPDIARSLGRPLVTSLLKINKNAFLPNVKQGEAILPRRYRNFDPRQVALLPLLRGERERSVALTRELFRYGDPIMSSKKPVYSEAHGRSMDIRAMVAAQARRNKGNPDLEVAELISSSIMSDIANASTRYSVGYEDNGKFIVRSRIIEIVDMTQVIRDKGHYAIALAHEHVHAHDAIDNPVIFETPEGIAASELRAYGTGYTFLTHGVVATDQARPSLYLKQLQRELGDPQNPYRPTPRLMDAMRYHGFTSH